MKYIDASKILLFTFFLMIFGVGVAAENQRRGIVPIENSTMPITQNPIDTAGSEATGEVINVDKQTNTFKAQGKDFALTVTKKGELPNINSRICMRGGDGGGGIYWGNRCPCSSSAPK